ncbi:unnamed protein product [Caenorhabditis auriculariae]|uniref:Uncharacterized protein n=1 Tax=Caenorhabditis auriculariae TaxID=2777116 RepID=A0A8S1GNA9_9PELO|nr:unnamed protein product [Caenorhabditis auriculariae]
MSENKKKHRHTYQLLCGHSVPHGAIEFYGVKALKTLGCKSHEEMSDDQVKEGSIRPTYLLPCGHRVPLETVEAMGVRAVNLLPCRQIADRVLPCGHTAKMFCYLSPIQISCPEFYVCKKRPSTGSFFFSAEHRFVVSCGQMIRNGFDYASAKAVGGFPKVDAKYNAYLVDNRFTVESSPIDIAPVSKDAVLPVSGDDNKPSMSR